MRLATRLNRYDLRTVSLRRRDCRDANGRLAVVTPSVTPRVGLAPGGRFAPGGWVGSTWWLGWVGVLSAYFARTWLVRFPRSLLKVRGPRTSRVTQELPVLS